MSINLPLSDQLAYSAVRLECKLSGGDTSTGSGFFFRFLDDGESHVPVIVTNKHVVSGAVAGKFTLHGLGPDGTPNPAASLWVEIDNFSALWMAHPDPSVDLCVLPVAELLKKGAAGGFKPFLLTLDPSLIPSDEEFRAYVTVEDVLMVGYPNGLWDSHNRLPIMRRGISATHPGRNYEGRTEFMIDAACFPGSSGSPVFLYNVGMYTARDGGTVVGNRVKLLGVLYGGPQYSAVGEIRIAAIPTAAVPVSVTSIPNNLGLVIRSSRLLELGPVLEKRRKRTRA